MVVLVTTAVTAVLFAVSAGVPMLAFGVLHSYFPAVPAFSFGETLLLTLGFSGLISRVSGRATWDRASKAAKR